MKTNEYVKYMTRTIVTYMDQPRDKRKQIRTDKKAQREPFLFKWFGMLPYAVILFRKRKR